MVSDPTQADAPKREASLIPARILVVEDDFLIRMMLVEVLADEGYDIVEAESGDEAIALFSASVDLVVTDIQLPGSLDGRELIARVREARPGLPAIYTSGRFDCDVPITDRDVSITKPYQVGDICAAIRRLLVA